MADDKRIPDLPQITNSSGGMKIPIWNPTTDVTNHIDLSDLLPEVAEESNEWDPDFSYSEDEIAVFEDQLYISLQDDNLDNLPSDPGSTFWVIGVKAQSGLVPWVAGIFTQTYVSVLKQIVADVWSLCYLVSATRPYNSTNFATEFAAGDWVIVRDPYAIINCDDLGAYTGGAGSDEYPLASNGAKGTGPAGAIRKNDEFTVPVGGINIDRGTGVEFLPAGMTLRAMVNAPGSTPANWKSY